MSIVVALDMLQTSLSGLWLEGFGEVIFLRGLFALMGMIP
jgi:hypothetical protein